MTDTSHPPIEYESPKTATDVSAVAVGTIGLTLLGLKTLIETLGSVPYLLNMVNGPTNAFATAEVSIAVSVGISFIASLVLMFFARPIASRLFRRLAVVPLDLGPPAWMTLLVSGIGLLLVFTSAEEAIRAAIYLFTEVISPARTPASTAAFTQALVTMLIPVVQLCVGMFLFLRPRALVRFWGRHAEL